MRSRLIPVVSIYLISFVGANLLVKHFGIYALWFSSFTLIPLDFTCRCILHEKWNGFKLVFNLFVLCLIAGFLTFLINNNARNIAFGSVCGFLAAITSASIFYQLVKQRSWFTKVLGSDFLAVIFDSTVFQLIAFGSIAPAIAIGQVAIKFAGGLFWYYILFKRFKIQNRL